MALKATVHKALVQLSDMDRHIYQSLSLTLAQHPSETDQRMMCRLVAFLFHYNEQLQFTKGLCVDDEPEIWQLDYSGEVTLWIDFGLVDEKRIRKACGRAKTVVIYCYGQGDADNWWQKVQPKLTRFDNLTVYRIPNEVLAPLSGLASKTMTLQCSIDQGEMWLSDATNSVQLSLETLYDSH